MNPKFLDYYNQELSYLRERGQSFAQSYPKVAGRIGLEGLECADPYVERLIESFAFLTARISLKMDSQFERFTQHMLERLYPHYLAPTPSMTVVRLSPRAGDGSVQAGYTVPRDSRLRARFRRSGQSACEYRTAHEVSLWPFDVAAVEYLPSSTQLNALGVEVRREVKAGLRITLECEAGCDFASLSLDRLDFYLGGRDHWPSELYEQLMIRSVGVKIIDRTSGEPRVQTSHTLPTACGYDDEQALLPCEKHSFQGYRLLQEYFACTNRFLFVRFDGLKDALNRISGTKLELVVLFNETHPQLAHYVDVSSLSLFCTPAVNLFSKRLERVQLDEKQHQYHLVPERTKPIDFEIYDILEIKGIGSKQEDETVFQPFYHTPSLNSNHKESTTYFTTQREPRVPSQRQRREGGRSNYLGSEVSVSLVDETEAPWSPALKQLAVTARCTNRDLPLHLLVSEHAPDFDLDSGAPVSEVHCLHRPSAPIPAPSAAGNAWRFISHLNLNYLSIEDQEDGETAAANLREMLSLYVALHQTTLKRQLEGIVRLEVEPAVHPMREGGYPVVIQGMRIILTLDESAFEGVGVVVFANVLSAFFRRHASINAFTQLQLNTLQRGVLKRWPIHQGNRQAL